jgi:molybdate transport system regulatory protein
VVVALQTPNKTVLTASISTQCAQAMGLKNDDQVIAFFQAGHVLVATGWALGISARNKFVGIAEGIIMGAVNTEVVVRLQESNDRISAIITTDAVRELALKPGDEVVAIIKASEVMLAK